MEGTRAVIISERGQ